MVKRKLNKKGKIVLFSIVVLFLIVTVLIFMFTKEKNIKVKVEDKKEIKKEVKQEEKLKIFDLDSNTRPYAVMINNISTVWGYQCGLQDAYLVYEIIVEGGYTRLMALFKDKTLDRIGSVRSSRHYFLDYALENDAIYVHFGWSPQAQNDISSMGINNINFMSYNGYIRDTSLPLAIEHTAFTSTDKIMSGASYYGYRTTTDIKTLFNYSVKSIDLSNIEGVIPANKIYINYSNSRSTTFVYDGESKVYKRYQNDIEHTDYMTGQIYTAKNIITYQVSNYSISGDDKGRQTLDNIGSGTGWYVTEGNAVPITWEKTSRESKTKYKYLDGTEIKINDGNTYVEIQPIGRDLVIE